MMSPYSSFSITITAMWDGAPPADRATGEGRVWIGSDLPPPPQAVSSTSDPMAATAIAQGRQPGMTIRFWRLRAG